MDVTTKINSPVGQIERLPDRERDVRRQLVRDEHEALVLAAILLLLLLMVTRMGRMRIVTGTQRWRRRTGSGFGNKAEELFHSLLVGTVGDFVQRKLMQDRLGAGFLPWGEMLRISRL